MHQSLTLTGIVVGVDALGGSFDLEPRAGGVIRIHLSETTHFSPLKNLDGIPRGTSPAPGDNFSKYIRVGRRFIVEGVLQKEGRRAYYGARVVHLLHNQSGQALFEESHWWITQTTRLADAWLNALFGVRAGYTIDDIALYRTNLNVAGMKTDETIQECATLSRLIYGLSSAFLLSGSARFLNAARACARYQQEWFRSLTHDAQACIWAFGKRGREVIINSENPDDRGTIPLYEQIYALAGLTQLYRITQDPTLLEDIRRTIEAFSRFFKDPGCHGGFFSHIDYATMSYETPALGANRGRKNWNSIGDHLPAYLINLILALDPLPTGSSIEVECLRATAIQMLKDTSSLIANRFIDTDNYFVNERFFWDWTPDKEWGWQRNRAIIGHNLKVAWTLTRVGYYYLRHGNESEGQRLLDLAESVARRMETKGLDLLRSGVLDAVERNPSNGMEVEFAWGNTKDFWQQEQGILAYLVLHGRRRDEHLLEVARELQSFWNVFFLDKDHGGIFFRVSDNGVPIIAGAYGQKASHSIAGYHMFELAYLTHVYTRAYVRDDPGGATFSLFFRPQSGARSLNVAPDFLAPDSVRIERFTVGGVVHPPPPRGGFQIALPSGYTESDVVVEYRAVPVDIVEGR